MSTLHECNVTCLVLQIPAKYCVSKSLIDPHLNRHVHGALNLVPFAVESARYCYHWREHDASTYAFAGVLGSAEGTHPLPEALSHPLTSLPPHQMMLLTGPQSWAKSVSSRYSLSI